MTTHNDAGRPYVMPSAPSRDVRYVPVTSDKHPWLDQAACVGWHPTPEDRDVPEDERRWLEFVDLPPKLAKAVCAECPVRQACLDRAMNMRPLPTDGVWGGLTDKELRAKAHTVTVLQVAEKQRGTPGPNCGKQAAVKKHRRNGELPCVECRDYLAAEQRRHRAAKSADLAS